jgi:HK97 family phage major capsid protein
MPVIKPEQVSGNTWQGKSLCRNLVLSGDRFVMSTIAEVIAAQQARLENAKAREQRAHDESKLILELAAKQGRTYLEAGESERSDKLWDDIGAAKDDQRKAEFALAELRKAEAEETEYQRKASESHPGAPRTGGGYTTQRALPRAGEPLSAPDRATDGPQWTREDGRVATVGRNERFADNAIVREQIERDPGRHLTETTSGIAQMVRNISTSGASAIVPTLWSASIIDKARNASQVLNAGAQLVPMDSKQLNLGRLTTDPTTAWLAEGGTRTESDPAFDLVSLVSKSLSCLTVASLEFLQDAQNADAVVEESIGKAMGLAIDYAALFGGVVAGGEGINQPTPPSPQGILANLLANASSSVLGSGANGTNITAATPWNELLTTYFTPQTFNEHPNAILMNVKMQQKYSMTYDTLGQPLRMPPVLQNIPILTTNQIPSFTQGTLTTATDIFCGDFTQVLWGQRLSVTTQVLTERYAEIGSVGILSTFRGDIALARPRAMCVYRYLQGA